MSPARAISPEKTRNGTLNYLCLNPGMKCLCDRIFVEGMKIAHFRPELGDPQYHGNGTNPSADNSNHRAEKCSSQTGRSKRKENKMKKNPVMTVLRDSGNGQFISKRQASRNPHNTWQKEQAPRRNQKRQAARR